MSDDLTTLTGTEDAVWSALSKGVRNPDSPGRTVALATQTVAGGGAVRMVVLRAVDREARTLTFFTHRASSKVSEIAAEPRTETLFWDPARQFQIRLNGVVLIADGPNDIWKGFGPGTRRNYAAQPEPGQRLTAPNQIAPKPDPETFLVLTLVVNMIETLWLAPDVQRRARFTNGRADWIAP